MASQRSLQKFTYWWNRAKKYAGARLVDQALVRATCMAQKGPMSSGTARYMYHSLPMRRSNDFTAMRERVGEMSRIEIILSLPFKDNNRFPFSVSTIHPRISLIILQYPLPAIAFLRLAESLISPRTEGNIYLREWSVRSKTLCWWAVSPEQRKVNHPFRRRCTAAGWRMMAGQRNCGRPWLLQGKLRRDMSGVTRRCLHYPRWYYMRTKRSMVS